MLFRLKSLKISGNFISNQVVTVTFCELDLWEILNKMLNMSTMLRQAI